MLKPPSYQSIFPWILGFCLLSSGLASSCVTLTRYKKVKKAKSEVELQNAMLFKELSDRKKEQKDLLDRLEAANKTNGSLELELSNATSELTITSKILGESSSKLLEENRYLVQQLGLMKNDNEKKSMVLNSIKSVQSNALESLYNCQQELSDKIFAWLNRGVSIEQMRDHVRITLPDELVFDQTGTNIGVNGYAVLSLLSKYLHDRPAIQVKIVSHTDNIIPRDKSIKDTWEWSMSKSVQITRMLIRDFNVNTNQLTPIAQGEYHPVASNADAEGRSKNRRTELLLYLPGFDYPNITELKQ